MKASWPPAALNPASTEECVRSRRIIRASLASVLKDGRVMINVCMPAFFQEVCNCQ